MPDVSNYNIENASGQNVRIDLNAVFLAIQSNNSKSTDLVESQCVAGMTFLNTTTNILKVRNSANNDFTDIGNINSDNLGLLPRAGGTMTGVLKIDDSNSASTPALSFDTDTDLGIFRKAANVLGFSANGEEQAFIDSNSLTISSKSNAAKELRFLEPSGAGSQYVGFKAPDTIASNVVWKLPNTDATVSGYALVSDTNGNLSWAAAGGGAVGSGNNEIFWENDQTVLGDYTITNNKNAGSFGPITIANGVTVTVGAGETWTVV